MSRYLFIVILAGMVLGCLFATSPAGEEDKELHFETPNEIPDWWGSGHVIRITQSNQPKRVLHLKWLGDSVQEDTVQTVEFNGEAIPVILRRRIYHLHNGELRESWDYPLHLQEGPGKDYLLSQGVTSTCTKQIGLTSQTYQMEEKRFTSDADGTLTLTRLTKLQLDANGRTLTETRFVLPKKDAENDALVQENKMIWNWQALADGWVAYVNYDIPAQPQNIFEDDPGPVNMEPVRVWHFDSEGHLLKKRESALLIAKGSRVARWREETREQGRLQSVSWLDDNNKVVRRLLFLYDAENRLTAVERDETLRRSLTYDETGRIMQDQFYRKADEASDEDDELLYERTYEYEN